MKNFISFIRNRGVVGFGVGFILGKAVSDLIGSFVSDIINPLVGLITGNLTDLSQVSVQVGSASLKYGNFILVVINFVILALVVYGLVKLMGLEKMDKAEEKK